MSLTNSFMESKPRGWADTLVIVLMPFLTKHIFFKYYLVCEIAVLLLALSLVFSNIEADITSVAIYREGLI